MSVQATMSVHINASPERVWPWIADITRHVSWSPKPYSVNHVGGEPNAVGSTYRSIGFVPPNDTEHANDVTITASEAMRHFALEARDANGVYHNTYDLAANAGGTDVTYHIAFPRMKGAAAILLPILFPLVGKADLRKRLQLLKQRVETEG